MASSFMGCKCQTRWLALDAISSSLIKLISWSSKLVKIVALIVGAGRGHRFGSPLPKQYHLLNGTPIIRHTIQKFLKHPDVATVQTIIHPDDVELFRNATEGLDIADSISGGKCRQESVFLGLQHLANYNPTHVLIHDAARPFVNFALISRVIEGLNTYPAAIPALPITDTVKKAKNLKVVKTIPRNGLWTTQTPQGFNFINILEAHKRFAGQSLTDDATLAENAGHELIIVEGCKRNVKITDYMDLENASKYRPMKETRTGLGYDVHAFGKGDCISLCGVQIAFNRGLIGHSDADVALHALTDALLGAIGAGDIGEHFPPDDKKWHGAPSYKFVHHAVSLITDRGGLIVNVDLTLICQEPKIGPHRKKMCLRLAEILSITRDRVSVKATTSEGLGFTGRNEGIAAHAIACVTFDSTN